MKKLLISIFAATAFLICSCNSGIRNFSSSKEENHYNCVFGDRSRSFSLYIPDTQNLEEVPLIVMLHGAGNSGEGFRQQTDFEKDALKENYAVLYIDGLPLENDKTSQAGWNNRYDKYGKKDMKFIVELTAFVQKEFGLKKKAYVVGFSNGGFMVNKLAASNTKCFNAYVSVGGMMPAHVWKNRKKARVRFFQINGTQDDVVPMELNGSSKYNPNPAMEKVVDFFAAAWGKINPIEEKINQKTTIQKYDNKVWWMLIKDYHHTWPKDDICKINVNEYIMEFIKTE